MARKIKMNYMSESEARKAIAKLCKNKVHNTTTIKEAIYTRVNLTLADQEILPSSKTVERWNKIVGNIVSHQKEVVGEYDGFYVLKNTYPATFVSKSTTHHLDS